MTTISDYGDLCPRCGNGALWEDCTSCGGEGEYDAYEEEPLWYGPGDTEPCSECGGKGGWYVCLGKCGALVVQAMKGDA